MDNLRYCVGCRERWVPGAKKCACGFVPPDLTPVDAGSDRSGLTGLWLLLTILGLAGVPIVIFDTGMFVLRDMTSHGSYRLWGQRGRDQDSIHLSAAGSVFFLTLALVVSIIRLARREEGAVWRLILTLGLLFVSSFLTLGAAIST